MVILALHFIIIETLQPYFLIQSRRTYKFYRFAFQETLLLEFYV